MTKQVETVPAGRKNIPHTILLTALLVIPGAAWALFGWVSSLLPLTAFVFIYKFGWRYSNRQFIIAILVSLFVSFFLQSLELTLFSVMLIPTGYMVAHSAQLQEEPWLACFKGAITLTVSLIVFFGVLLASSEISLFTALTESLDRAIEETLKHYQQSGTLSSENYLILEQTLYQMKTIGPMVIPAILASIIVLISWTTVVLGNSLLYKLGNSRPWPEYRYWSLPDKLIWGLIISGVLALIPGGTMRIFGINALIIFSLLYCFQGLAILIFLLKKWNIPRMMRLAIYVVMILQSFGTIILLGAGIAEVWFEIRQPPTSKKNDTTETE